MHASETWTLLAIEWLRPERLDLETIQALADRNSTSSVVCDSPIAGVSLIAYRSATSAVEDGLRVVETSPAKAVALTFEHPNIARISADPMGLRVFELLRLLPSQVAACGLSTYEAVRHAISDEMYLTDLGPVGLPELGGKERVFRIGRAGVPVEELVLDRGERTIDTLPDHFGYFVGRKLEMEELFLHLERGHNVTVTGIEGVVKSHLAVRVAREAKGNYSSGVAWVSLAEATTAPRFVEALARGLTVPKGEGAEAAVRRVLSDEQVLVILDGADQVMDHVRDLLNGPCRGSASRFIITAASPIGYADEIAIPVPPMTTPPEGLAMDGDSLYDFEASALFLDRVTELSPSLLDYIDPDATADLVRCLEGHPHRIVVAADLTRFQSVPQILADAKSKPVRRGPSKAFSHMFAALPGLCQDLMIAMGVCETSLSKFQIGQLDRRFVEEPSAIETLRQCGLCEESLAPSGRLVYRLYPSVRSHVQKVGSPARKRLESKLADLFITLVNDAVSSYDSTESGQGLEVVEEHAADYVAALRHCVGRTPLPEFVELMKRGWSFFYDHNHVDEGIDLVERAWQAMVEADAISRARILNIGAALATKVGRIEYASQRYSQSLACLGDDGDVMWRARIICNQSWLSWAAGNPELGRSQAMYAADLFRMLGQTDDLADVLITIVICHLECGDPETADAVTRESLALQTKSSPINSWTQALARGMVAWGYARLSEAQSEVLKALEVARSMGDDLSTLRSLIWLAQVLNDAKAYADGARVLAVAAQTRAQLSYRLHPANEARVARIQATLAAGLGEQSYRREMIAGSAQSLDQVLGSICRV